jgi:hypothetical protein
MKEVRLVHNTPTEAYADAKTVVEIRQEDDKPPMLSVGYIVFQFDSWDEYYFFVRLAAAFKEEA